MEGDLRRAAAEIEGSACSTKAEMASLIRQAADFVANLRQLRGSPLFVATFEWKDKLRQLGARQVVETFRLVEVAPPGFTPVRLGHEGHKALFARVDESKLAYSYPNIEPVSIDMAMLELVRSFPIELGQPIANTYAAYNNLPSVKVLPSPPQLIAAVCSTSLYITFLDSRKEQRIYSLITPSSVIEDENGDLFAVENVNYMYRLD